MPTVLRHGPYRFFFYSSDRGEPPHVHVERDDCVAKLWLSPLRLGHSVGYPRGELAQVERLAEANLELLLRAWHEHFAD